MAKRFGEPLVAVVGLGRGLESTESWLRRSASAALGELDPQFDAAHRLEHGGSVDPVKTATREPNLSKIIAGICGYLWF